MKEVFGFKKRNFNNYLILTGITVARFGKHSWSLPAIWSVPWLTAMEGLSATYARILATILGIIMNSKEFIGIHWNSNEFFGIPMKLRVLMNSYEFLWILRNSFEFLWIQNNYLEFIRIHNNTYESLGIPKDS